MTTYQPNQAYNYKTNQWEPAFDIDSASDERIAEFLPQDPITQARYKRERKSRGKYGAFIRAMERHCEGDNPASEAIANGY